MSGNDTTSSISALAAELRSAPIRNNRASRQWIHERLPILEQQINRELRILVAAHTDAHDCRLNNSVADTRPDGKIDRFASWFRRNIDRVSLRVATFFSPQVLARSHGEVHGIALARKQLTILRYRCSLIALIKKKRRKSLVARHRARAQIAFDDSGRVVVICHNYPAPSAPYPGAFIHQRVRAYSDLGLSPEVFCLTENASTSSSWIMDGVCVWAGDVDRLVKFLEEGELRALLVHSPKPKLCDVLLQLHEQVPVAVWYHGAETRDYSRLLFNYSIHELKLSGSYLERQHFERMCAAYSMYRTQAIPKIFVSNYLRSIGQEDVGAQATNANVIPNYVNPTLFQYKQKQPHHRKKVLLVRPFTRYNYGADLAIVAIERAAKQEFFKELSIHIQGFGAGFKRSVSSLSKLPNVSIGTGVLTQPQLADLFEAYGVFLNPSRHDTQGVTMCEAMSAGLVPITHAIGGIPEFVDASCGFLCDADSVADLVDGMAFLAGDAQRYMDMSQRASRMAVERSGINNTIRRELIVAGVAK